jgi:hypothetical protein
VLAGDLVNERGLLGFAAPEPKRANALPFLSARNFVKVKLISPPVDRAAFRSVRDFNKGPCQLSVHTIEGIAQERTDRVYESLIIQGGARL